MMLEMKWGGDLFDVFFLILFDTINDPNANRSVTVRPKPSLLRSWSGLSSHTGHLSKQSDDDFFSAHLKKASKNPLFSLTFSSLHTFSSCSLSHCFYELFTLKSAK